jgi:Lon protease-like protein
VVLAVSTTGCWRRWERVSAEIPLRGAPEPPGLLPLFPLRTVLFPGGLLPLRIFEPRYLDMIGACMRSSTVFGVILIRAGGETGAVTTLADIGTSAQVVDFEQREDGLLGILCRGGRRFRLSAREVRADGLHVGQVEWLPLASSTPLAAADQPLAAVLRKVLVKMGATGRFLEPRFEDADWVSNRIAELLPLQPEHQQQLLEIDDAAERIARLTPLVELDR